MPIEEKRHELSSGTTFNNESNCQYDMDYLKKQGRETRTNHPVHENPIWDIYLLSDLGLHLLAWLRAWFKGRSAD